MLCYAQIYHNVIDQVLLERYLQINFNNVDNAIRLLKHNLVMRQKAPYLFENRDIMSNEIQTACTTLYVFHIQSNTGNELLIVY